MRTIIGTVVSDKMKKTVVVEVEITKINQKYRKSFKIQRRFKAHDEQGEYKVGDKVMLEATRPLSKEKRWRVTGKV